MCETYRHPTTVTVLLWSLGMSSSFLGSVALTVPPVTASISPEVSKEQAVGSSAMTGEVRTMSSIMEAESEHGQFLRVQYGEMPNAHRQTRTRILPTSRHIYYLKLYFFCEIDSEDQR